MYSCSFAYVFTAIFNVGLSCMGTRYAATRQIVKDIVISTVGRHFCNA